MPNPEYAKGRRIRQPSRRRRLARAKALGWETSRPGGEPEATPYAMAPLVAAAALAGVGLILAILSLVPTDGAGVALLALGTVLLLAGGPWLAALGIHRRVEGPGTWALSFAIALSIVVIMAGVSALGAAHASRVASRSITQVVPISAASFPGGDSETKVAPTAQLVYDATYDETYLNVDFTATGERTPQMSAEIVGSSGQSFSCEMQKSHLTYGGALVEKFGCSDVGRDVVTSATSVSITTTPGYE